MEFDLLRHSLATIAYRFQKSVRNAPEEFAEYMAGSGVRQPVEIVRHMRQVILFAVGAVTGSPPAGAELANAGWDTEIARFHAALGELDRLLATHDLSAAASAKIIQGPLADVLCHVGQLAMLSRMSGVPVPGENYSIAPITVGNVSANQDIRS